MAPWPLIGLDIFDFSSETPEQNSTKLDRKQDLNVLYQVCVFGPFRKTRWPPWPLIGRDIFDFSSETVEGISTKLDRKQDFNVLYQVCVSGQLVYKNGRPGQSIKRWHIVLRCTLCGPWGLWFMFGAFHNFNASCWFWAFHICKKQISSSDFMHKIHIILLLFVGVQPPAALPNMVNLPGVTGLPPLSTPLSLPGLPPGTGFTPLTSLPGI